MAISDDGKLLYNLDYRSKKDVAWYTSAVVLENGKRLRVKFQDFESSYYDEVFSIANFSAHHDIEEFLRRFRPVTVPVEVNECSRVTEGMLVCATYTGDGSVRYFDAIVDANENKGNKLMVVRFGTEEYKRAKISKDLYMEYRNHLNGLAKRLDMEEMKK